MTTTDTALAADLASAKGMILSVYTNPRYRSCAAGGLSETHDEVTVVGIRTDSNGPKGGEIGLTPMPKCARVFAPSEKAPAVVLVKRWIGRTVWHVEPLTTDGTSHWFMDGGSYAATSDSRIGEITGIYGALSIHDREE